MNAPFAVLLGRLTSFTGFGFVVIWLAISWASFCRRQKSLPISRARPALTLGGKNTHVHVQIPTCRCIFTHLIHRRFKVCTLKSVELVLDSKYWALTERPYSNAALTWGCVWQIKKAIFPRKKKVDCIAAVTANKRK